jgi:hypothetical protein
MRAAGTQLQALAVRLRACGLSSACDSPSHACPVCVVSIGLWQWHLSVSARYVTQEKPKAVAYFTATHVFAKKDKLRIEIELIRKLRVAGVRERLHPHTLELTQCAHFTHVKTIAMKTRITLDDEEEDVTGSVAEQGTAKL